MQKCERDVWIGRQTDRQTLPHVLVWCIFSIVVLAYEGVNTKAAERQSNGEFRATNHTGGFSYNRTSLSIFREKNSNKKQQKATKKQKQKKTTVTAMFA